MSLFAKAVAAAPSTPGTKKKDEDIVLIPPVDVAKAIDALEDGKKKKKESESEIKAAKGMAEPWAKGEFLKMFAEKGVRPDSFKVKGVKTTAQFINQDRAGVNDVSNEQLELLKTILGGKRAEGLVSEFTEFGLNVQILNMTGVADAISKALESIPGEILSDAQKVALLVPTPRRVLKEGIVDRLAILCDNDVDKMTLVADALGSNLTCYLK